MEKTATFDEYKRFTTIVTYHMCPYYGIFKPDFREIVSQLPNAVLSYVDAVAFEEDSYLGIYANGSHHRAILNLYV